jgi:hypothetical protein
MKSSIGIDSAHSASAGEFGLPSEALRADRPDDSHVVYLFMVQEHTLEISIYYIMETK